MKPATIFLFLFADKSLAGPWPQPHSPDWLRVRVLRTTGMKSRKLLFAFFSKEPGVMGGVGQKAEKHKSESKDWKGIPR